MEPEVTTPSPLWLMVTIWGWLVWSLNGHFLEVQEDVGDVLPDPGHGGEFVLHTLDPDIGDGRALDAAEQHPAQGMTAGRGETALERIGDEFAVGARLGART